jgi:hypothetical protein
MLFRRMCVIVLNEIILTTDQMNVIVCILTNSTAFTFIQFDSTILLLRMDTPKNTPNYTQNGLGYGAG